MPDKILNQTAISPCFIAAGKLGPISENLGIP